MKPIAWLAVAVALLIPSISLADGPPEKGRVVSLESLLKEMTDLDAAARWPGYTCRQASSYDRASKSPADAQGWFANNDHSQYIREETNHGRREHVMMDADGPGAVVRMWWGGDYPPGIMRFYLDGSDEPAIQGGLKELMVEKPLVSKPLAIENAHAYKPGVPGGLNLYLPIAYAKHCKITWAEPENGSQWYNIEYRTYPPGTAVQTFSMDDLKAHQSLIEQTCRILTAPPPAPEGVSTSVGNPVPAKAEAVLDLPAGQEAVRQVELSFEGVDAKGMTAALRHTIIKATFDGEDTIWAPLGDFFGSGIGLNELQSWYRQVSKDGHLSCRWVMPYQKSARIALLNLDTDTIAPKLKVITSPWTWDDRSMHFHANWRQQRDIATRPFSDWNYIDIKGKGVYMGDTLCVFNPVKDWWGEGDEKIFVDDESFPSHFGTGSEDYYCYSWGNTTLFQGPFANQVRADGPGNAGQVVNTRTRSLDAIPFSKSLRFDMEIWHWADTHVTYGVTTYWYGLPGATCNRSPQPEEASAPLSDFQRVKAPPGSIEAEDMKVLSKTGGVIETQTDMRWSGEKQLWWRDAKVGDKLELQVNVAKAGRYRLSMKNTLAVDYGILQVSVDDQKIGPAVDLYNNEVKVKPAILGECELSAGDHRLSFEVVGANAKAEPRHMLGLDYVTLEPLPN